ncbi:MAG: DsbA family protein [Rhodospirillaceae bacterium]|nr:DsbA family protein [Rhodospirillaceae bacterium]
MKPFASAAFGCAAVMLALVGTASCSEEDSQDPNIPSAQSEMGTSENTTADSIKSTNTQQVSQAADGAATETSGPVYREMIYGDPAAPVTIVEYASLTCSHCASFHNAVLPEIKKNYIDTGKVRLVFRDFPLDGLAMAGAMLARCADGDRGKALISVMFRQQGTWVMSERPIEPLTSYAKLAGLDEDGVNACLENENIMVAIREGQETGTNRYKIASTPTFFIEDVKVEGNRGYDYMAKIIDEKLAEKDS